MYKAPLLKAELESIIRRLQDVSEDTNMHLTDCGMVMCFIKDDLTLLIDETFAAHQAEIKNLVVS